VNKNQDQESAAVRRANLHFRKEIQAREGAEAWKAYNAEADATRQLTAKLRQERLTREANALANARTPKPAKKPASRRVRRP
jgi:hypothetical protein